MLCVVGTKSSSANGEESYISQVQEIHNIYGIVIVVSLSISPSLWYYYTLLISDTIIGFFFFFCSKLGFSQCPRPLFQKISFNHIAVLVNICEVPCVCSWIFLLGYFLSWQCCWETLQLKMITSFLLQWIFIFNWVSHWKFLFLLIYLYVYAP